MMKSEAFIVKILYYCIIIVLLYVLYIVLLLFNFGFSIPSLQLILCK